MTLYRQIDGKPVAMSAEEEAQVRAEWAAEDAKPARTKAEKLTDQLSRSPVLSALLDEVADARGQTRAAVLTRIASKLP